MTDAKMTYRFLGNSGLLVSKLALGSWIYDPTEPRYTAENWYKLMTTAFQHGVNFFDNSENYAERRPWASPSRGASTRASGRVRLWW
jgi:aryl-alcohol dehydrogenase-like predicted oxidoreductase